MININKINKTCCRRVLSETLTPFYFRCFFLFRASLTKQHFISGLCHGITFWTTTNTNLHVVLVAFLAGTTSQCYLQDVFFSFARGKSPYSPAKKNKKLVMLLSAWSLQFFLILVTSQQTSRIAPEGYSSPFFKIAILWVSTKLEVSP